MKKIILSSSLTAIAIFGLWRPTANDIELSFIRLIGSKQMYNEFVASHRAIEFCYDINTGVRFESRQVAFEEVRRCIKTYEPMILSGLQAE